MYLFCTLALQTFGGTLITTRQPFVVTLSQFEYKRESSDGGMSQLISEFLSSRIRHPLIILLTTDILVGSVQ